MAEPSPGLLSAIRTVDRFTDWSGTAFSWLAVPLVLVVAWEVTARYVLHAPTSWAFEITYMMYGSLFMLGAAYALLKGAHIRTDFFWEKFSVRKKGWIDTISYVVFFFPSLLTLLYLSVDETIYALEMGEVSDQTPWRPYLWPYKSVIPLACLFLLIQGLSELLKSLYMARTGIEIDHKEKIEV
jgi:TRAP-type mannitol/chloroaromatic compound transport system permease small subunit